MLAALPALSLQIVEFFREHGRVTMAEAIKLTGAGRNTLKQHSHDLVERRHMERHGSGRGAEFGEPGGEREGVDRPTDPAGSPWPAQ